MLQDIGNHEQNTKDIYEKINALFIMKLVNHNHYQRFSCRNVRLRGSIIALLIPLKSFQHAVSQHKIEHVRYILIRESPRTYYSALYIYQSI